MSGRTGLRIAIVHPDFVLGGAERLILDAALALGRAGHDVVLHTPHLDPSRSFEEARDGTVQVRVHGSAFPRTLLGKLRAPLTIARTAAAARGAAATGFDVAILDQVAHCVPPLARAGGKVLFYCHFPDRLLAARDSWLRTAYRAPIDRLEERGLEMADAVLVNSRFTAAAFARAFGALPPPRILAPAIDCSRYAQVSPLRDDGGDVRVLAISRFDSRKRLELATESFACLRGIVAPELAGRLRLTLAGGCDDRSNEDRTALASLRALALRLGIAHLVTFEPNISEQRKLELLRASRCVAYTPSKEHFGYVPIEAMAAARPVVVPDTGGPLESVRDGVTGFVRAPDPHNYAAALATLVSDAGASVRMGEAGRSRVMAEFSMEAFGARLDTIVRELAARD